MPIVNGSGNASGGSRPYISDTETGIIVNEAGGFVSDWETFDLLEPGVGYGIATITAADGDGLVWDTDISAAIDIEVSVDGVTWIPCYGSVRVGAPLGNIVVLQQFATNANPVGLFAQYIAITPRAIRFAGEIVDANTGDRYAGPDSPSFAFTFHYTAS